MKKTYKQYEEYKDSGIDWLGEVPSHWRLEKGKWLFIRMDRPPLPTDKIVTCFRDGEVTLRENRRTDGFTTALKEHGYQGIRKGDLIIHAMDAFAGAIGVSDSDGKSTPVYSVCTPRIKEINQYYYAYLLRNLALSGYIEALAKGIRERSTDFRFADFSKLILPLPPLTEQQRIADFLDQKTSNIDKAIAQKEELIALLNERKQILINKAVTRGLDENAALKDSGVEWIGEIPEHWEVRKLKYCAKIVSTKMEAKNNELAYLGMENIESKTGRFIKTESEAEGLANYFDKDNILFGKLRPYLAKVYLAIDKGICSSEFLVYETSKSIVNPTHFKNILLSASFIQLIDSSTYGSKMPRANADYIGNQELPLPPLSEQQQIATFIEEQSTKIDQAIAQKEEEINLLKEYKSSLIDSAVRGKICLV